MKILLDAKDLINVVEHSKPLSLSDLEAWLHQKDAKLVYSLENIRALAGPVGVDHSQLSRIIGYLDQLEQVPHCFISCNIDLMELRSAIRAFENHEEYESINPYVSRFDCVFPQLAKPDRSDYRIAEVVSDLWSTCPQIFGPRPNLHEIHAHAMGEDRNRPKARGAVKIDFPSEPTIETLVNQISIPEQLSLKITNWIAVRPSRCPALWLVRAIGMVMSRDRHYSSRPGDVFDISDTMAIPYVDMATLDRTMRHYCSLAIQALELKSSLTYTSDRVFKNLTDLLEASL